VRIYCNTDWVLPSVYL